jgi:hypothetical protein
VVQFAPLQQGFPKLTELARHMSDDIPPPPDIRSLGERVYEQCAHLTEDRFGEIRPSTWRKVPFAMWLDSRRDINSNVPLIERYFKSIDELNPIESARARRRLSPLLHVYATHFDPSEPAFVRLALHLDRAALHCSEVGVCLLSLARLRREWRFFDVSNVGDSVASGLLNDLSDLKGVEDWFSEAGLWPGFKDTKLGRHIFSRALVLPAETYRDDKNINALATWAKSYGKNLSMAEKAGFAEALLRPWLQGDPDEVLQRRIGDLCVERLGDPRRGDDARGGAGGWSRVDVSCRDLLLRWLTGRTLEAFFDVLRLTADQIWQHRQAFWTGYYREGYITEAWAVLGSDAQALVRRRFQGADLHFGKLVGQVDTAQSVLLMRMGEVLFSEWSHNGKLRAAEVGSRQAPRMYEKAYDADDLRFRSMKFMAANGTEHAGLPHLHSETRWWQETAARFIRTQLGVRLS